MIKNDLKEFHLFSQNLEEYEGLLYYASDGMNVFTNSAKTEKEQFKAHPAYMIFEDYKRELYPKEVKENGHLYPITESIDELDPESTVVYVAFTEQFLNQKVKEWKENKAIATNNLYQINSISRRIYTYVSVFGIHNW